MITIYLDDGVRRIVVASLKRMHIYTYNNLMHVGKV